MILLIDNYDSFTYNIYQFMSELGAQVEVLRNDEATIEEIDLMAPERIVVSPGPKTPSEAGVSVDAVRHFGPRLPVLGVCLGHQCVGEAFGGSVGAAGEIMHGKTSLVHHDGRGVFAGLPSPFKAIRYHSLAIDRDRLPGDLQVSAWTDRGVIMGVRHADHPVEGVQFHPESIKTEHGKALLKNFIELPLTSAG